MGGSCQSYSGSDLEMGVGIGEGLRFENWVKARKFVEINSKMWLQLVNLQIPWPPVAPRVTLLARRQASNANSLLHFYLWLDQSRHRRHCDKMLEYVRHPRMDCSTVERVSEQACLL